jgi:hypothetical protein
VNLGAAAYAAEEHTGAGRQRLNRGAEDGRLRRGLKRKAYALPSNRSEFRDHVVAAGVIDGVRRTELARKPFCEWP